MSALILLTFAAVFIALEVGSFTGKSATWDEPIHLTAGYLAATDGDYRVDPSHPPFLRMWTALPLLAMDGIAVNTSPIDTVQDDVWLQQAYLFATRFLYREQGGDRLLYAARFMVVLLGIALGALLFFWAREWLGLPAAIIALAFYALEPNIAAHARLVTTDLGIAFFIFATVYWLWRTSRQPNRTNIAGLTVCFALALVTKFSGVLLVPIVAFLLVVALRSPMRLRLRTAGAIVGLLAVSTFVAVWAVYGFRYAPSASAGWVLRLQDTQIVQQEAPMLGKIVSWVDAQHVLPNAFTQGFLMSQASGRQTAYLAGAYSEDGWWYYFPVVFLLKTPSALIVLVVGSVILLIIRRRQLGIANEAFVVLPVVVYMGFAMASGINIGLRHILPIYPFLLLMAAAAAKALTKWRKPVGQVVLVGLTAYWGLRYANVYPHMLTYVSVFVGGPRNGPTYLADSNLDWGQDLKSLREWMSNEKVDHINLAYFGTADPEYYGIEGTYLPGTPFWTIKKPVLPGYVAISATILSGVYLEPRWRLFYAGFLHLPPVATVGNSIYVFRIDQWPDAQANGRRAEDAAVRESLADGLFFELDWAARAIPHYEEALERAPDNASILEKLGLALLNAGRTKDAIATLRRAAVLDPLDGNTRYRLALSLLEDGQPDEAAVQAEAAVQLKPNDAAARDLLGVASAARRRPATAASTLEKAPNGDPVPPRSRATGI